VKPFRQLSYWWWYALPVVFRRRPLLSGVLRDGNYLAAVPPLGAVAPIAAFCGGIVIGWARLGQGDIYTTSLPVMIAMLAVGSLGAALGLWLWVGFVLGDLWLWTGAPPRHFGGLVTAYLLLLILVVVIPLGAGRLRREFSFITRRLGPLQAIAEGALQVVFAVLLVYSWAHAAPPLIRSIYDLHNAGLNPVGPFAPLQNHPGQLVSAAAIATAVRVTAEMLSRSLAAPPQPVGRPFPRLTDAISRRWVAVTSGPRATIRRLVLSLVPPHTRAVFRGIAPILVVIVQAVVAAIMLRGILAGSGQQVLVGAIIAGVLLLRLLFGRLSPVSRVITAVPVPLRLLLGWFIASVIARSIINASSQTTFTPIVTSAMIGLGILALLMPRGQRGVADREPARRSPPSHGTEQP